MIVEGGLGVQGKPNVLSRECACPGSVLSRDRINRFGITG